MSIDNKPSPAEIIANLYLLAEKTNNPIFIEQAKQMERTSGLSTLTEECLKQFITQDPECERLKTKVRKLVTVDDPILIQGETGTGKEIIANALHGGRKGAFVAINCAGMPHELIESEMFGYAAGAFTGAAAKGTPGLIRTAEGGTLFLDEIGDLPLTAQAKLLRVIQEKKVRPVGGTEIVSVNVRFVAATHHELDELVEQKLFRRDLYARLCVFELRIPAIRYRIDDVKPIIQSYDKTGNFPFGKWRWLELPLNNNVRDLQAIYKRWLVLGEQPI